MSLRTLLRMTSSNCHRFIDIGVNLTDPMYMGEYNGSKKHDADLEQVLERSLANGVENLLVTGGSLADSKKALELARTKDFLFSTVGCHPTRCREFLDYIEGDEEKSASAYLADLTEIVHKNRDKVMAIGECGLDYDRLHFCDKETQLKYFEFQLDLAEKTELPLFLHCRNSADDLAEILTRNADRLKGGVVHSFDGTWEEAELFLNLGYYIGINGCSLKTEGNLEVVKRIPSDRILLETDAPWCEIRPSHAGSKFVATKFPQYKSVKRDKWVQGALVKSRNEPCFIRQVFEVVCGVRDEKDPQLFAETIYDNTARLFFSDM